MAGVISLLWLLAWMGDSCISGWLTGHSVCLLAGRFADSLGLLAGWDCWLARTVAWLGLPAGLAAWVTRLAGFPGWLAASAGWMGFLSGWDWLPE
jgi:hypothetical protein